MPDQHARVTVVGSRRSANLAVPALVPIAQFIGSVTRLIGEPTDAALPAAWSLAPDGRAPFPPTATLEACGVVDGQVLHLRDVLADESAEPVVFEVEEAVEDASRRYARTAWTRRAQAAVTLTAGAAWLAALPAVLAGAGRSVPDRPAAGLCLGAGLAAAAAAAALRGRTAPWLRGVLAFAAVPAFAAAAALLFAAGHAGAGGLGAATAVGSLIGGLLALAAAPSTALLLVPAMAAVALAAATILAAAHQPAAGCAAVTVLILLAALRSAPPAVSLLVAHSPLERPGPPGTDPTALRVHRTRVLLALTTATLGAAEALALAWLTSVGGRSGGAMAGCAAAALVLGAGMYKQLTEVVPHVVAGTVGLLAVAVELPDRWQAGPWAATAAGYGLGAAVLAAGALLALRGDGPPSRSRLLSPLAGLLQAACLPLCASVLGLFARLTGLGHSL